MGFVKAVTASLATLITTLPTLIGADKPYHIDHQSYEAGAFGEVPSQTFHSSNIKAPIYQINYWDHGKIDTESPYMFMAGQYGNWGPSIVSSKDLSLVWADQNYHELAQIARTGDLNGTRVLITYSEGRVRVYDEYYRELYVLDGRGDLQGIAPDSHEAALTHDGHILMFLCPEREADLRPVGGPEKGKRIKDCIIQEIEPETNEIVFQWATTDYFKPEDSVWDYNNDHIWDFCHMNSVEKTEEGNYLISYRHLSTLIMVNGQTKEVMWVMWGKKNMFTDVSDRGSATFAFQHEARVSGKNRIILFDNHRHEHNGYCDQEAREGCSRGLEIEYDPKKKTVWMVNEWYHPQGLLSASRGGIQRTPSGNVIVAWGQNPSYTEYTAEGEVVMDIQRGRTREIEHGIFSVITYRIWKGDWVGRPNWGPNISCQHDDVSKSVYVSWNGATEVDHWVLFMSDDITDLKGADKVVAQSPRNGFETRFELEGLDILGYARVAALDAHGRILGSTPAVNTTSYQLTNLEYGVGAVFKSGANGLPSSVPSSAKVSVPTGTVIPDLSAKAEPLGDKSEPNLGPSESSENKFSSPRVVGGAVGSVVFCAMGIMGLFIFLRRYGKNQHSQYSDGFQSEATYGLLPRGNEERYEDGEDDKDWEKNRATSALETLNMGSR